MVTLLLGLHQNRVAGFPRPTRKELAASRRKVRACEPLVHQECAPTVGRRRAAGLRVEGSVTAEINSLFQSPT